MYICDWGSLFYIFPHYIQCRFMFMLICTFIMLKDNIRQKRREDNLGSTRIGEKKERCAYVLEENLVQSF